MKSQGTITTLGCWFSRALALVAGMALVAPIWAITGVDVGPSGKTYASAGLRCAMNPITGMAPMVQAGLYNPKKTASATVSLNGAPYATVTFSSPDTPVWLVNDVNTVAVTVDKKTTDTYSFDATVAYPGQPNVCIPDTRNNAVINGLEYAASNKSYATVTSGCAVNPSTGRAQPFVNLFDNGTYLLNVSVNNLAVTQLNGTRPHAPIFLSAGLNVIWAANGSISTDYYVRDGGSGACTLP